MKVIRLKENDIQRIVKRVLNEQDTKYGEVTQYIKGFGESIYKMINEISKLISQLNADDNKNPNLYKVDEPNEFGEAISELLILLASATPIENDQYGKYMSQVQEPARRDAILTARTLDRALSDIWKGVLNGSFGDMPFTTIVEDIITVFKRINSENVARRKRNEPYTSPVDYIYRNPDATRIVEKGIEQAEQGVDAWLTTIGEKLKG